MDFGMSGDQGGARYEAWLLSKLLQTPPSELDGYREAYFEGRELDLENLEVLQACLVELSRALRTNQEHGWKRVHRAASALGATPVEGHRTVTDGEAGSAERVDPLPFVEKPGSAPPHVVPSLEPNPALGATAPLGDGARPSPRSLPFTAPPQPDAVVSVGTISLTLEHYAELVAVGTRTPDAWAQRRNAFGIADDETFTQLDRAWQERFAHEPELQRRWLALYQRALEEERTA
jgi:hypothetical protein